MVRNKIVILDRGLIKIDINCVFGTQKKKYKIPAGFTLLELLIVILILGIVLTTTSISIFQNDDRALLKDTKRLASLFRLAREEAILRNTPIAVKIDNSDYQFFTKNRLEWIPIENDSLLRTREFSIPNISISSTQSANEKDELMIIFGLEPVAQPFKIFLSTPTNRSSINADGLGNFHIY